MLFGHKPNPNPIGHTLRKDQPARVRLKAWFFIYLAAAPNRHVVIAPLCDQ